MKSNIPTQYKGSEVNVSETIVARSKEEADLFFNNAIKRLIHVNEWHTLTHPTVSRFQLTDFSGHEIFRAIHKGDLIRIAIPAPGSIAGEGFDWVKVEEIDYSFENVMHSVSVRVRPVPSPFHPDDGVAHFFDSIATSTFKVNKMDLTIMAGIYCRNEIRNVKCDKVIDNIRNAAVASGAILGASKIQWSNLVKGILNIK